MDTDLEPARSQILEQSPVGRISLGHEIERRSEAVALVEVRHFGHERLAICPFDVVRQRERVMGAVRPERRRRPLWAAQHLMEKAYEAILNRPGERKRRFLTASIAASQKRCGSAREQWFESVVQSPSAAQLVPLRS